MNPKYCPKHKYIEPKCLACMTRYASALGTKNVRLEAVAEAAREIKKNHDWVLEAPTKRACGIGCDMGETGPGKKNEHDSDCRIKLLVDKLAALDREPGERGGK